MCLKVVSNTFFWVYKNLIRFSSHIKEKFIKINFKKNPHMNENSFSSLFVAVDTSLVISLQEQFANDFYPSRINSSVRLLHVLCYIDVMTNWKSSSIASTNNNVYWVTIKSLFLFQWSIILEWFQEKKKRAGVETKIFFSDICRLCRKGLFTHKWLNGK